MSRHCKYAHPSCSVRSQVLVPRMYGHQFIEDIDQWPSGHILQQETERLSKLYFSNVIEKCVSHSSRLERAMLIEEVCNTTDGYGLVLVSLLNLFTVFFFFLQINITSHCIAVEIISIEMGGTTGNTKKKKTVTRWFVMNWWSKESKSLLSIN